MMTEQKIVGYKGTLQFSFGAEDRAEYGWVERSFKVVEEESTGRCWEVWLPGKPTLSMPDDLTDGSIDPWDDSLEGVEVIITRVGTIWNYGETDSGILWHVVRA